MAIIHLPRKSGDKMPQSIRGIKNSSPFSVNLVMASLGGYDNLQRDLVSGAAAYSVGSGVSHGAQSLGRGAEYDGTSSGVIRQYISSDYVNAAPLSMATWIYRTSTTAGVSGLALHPTGTANDPWIVLSAAVAADEARFIVRTGTTYSKAASAAGAGTMMLAGVAESTTVRKVYVNGAYGASSATDSINPADLTIQRSVSGILDRSSVVTSAAGSIVYSTMLWSERAMDAAELAALYSPTHRWDWVDQGTRRIFLPAPLPVVTSLTTIRIPRKSGTRAPTRVRGISRSSVQSQGLVSAGIVENHGGAPYDYAANTQLAYYANKADLSAGTLGRDLRFNDTRNGEALALEHLGADWFDARADLTFGVLVAFNGVADADGDTLFGNWRDAQGSIDASSDRILLTYTSTGTPGLELYFRNSGGGYPNVTVSKTLATGRYYWIVGRFTNSTISLFVDGENLGNTGGAGTIKSTAGTKYPEVMGGNEVTGSTSVRSPRFSLKSWFLSDQAWTDSTIQSWNRPQTRWDMWDQGTRRIFLSEGGGAASRSVTLRQGSIYLTGQNSSASLARTMTLQQGLIHLTGQSAGATLARTMTLQQGLIHLIGQSPSVGLARDMTLQQALIHLTGQNVGISTDERSVTLQQALIHITGQDLGVTLSRDMTLQQGLIHLTGQDTEVAFSTFLAAWARLSNRTINIGTRSRIT